MNQQEENFDNINFAETKEETDKKCPQCGGIMDFDPKTGHMKCCLLYTSPSPRDCS